MTAIPLGAGGEFDRVRAIAAALGAAAGRIGDDTAVIAEGEGTLVVSVDASVEGVHFRRDWLSFEEIGWRAAASAMSDLAAAAATPIGLVTAVVVPHGAGPDDLVNVMRGIGNAAASLNAKVFGGDLSSGTEWTIAITVFGRAIHPMSRVGAVAGDGVWVTGALGGAAAALNAWRSGIAPEPGAREVFAHPVPRIAAAQWLAARGATAMMDLSDGVGGDAEHLAAASGVRLHIDLDRLPMHAAVAAAARRTGEEPELFAAAVGEDYELLFTLPSGFDPVKEHAHEAGIALTKIGTVELGVGVHATLRGAVRVIKGFRHAL